MKERPVVLNSNAGLSKCTGTCTACRQGDRRAPGSPSPRPRAGAARAGRARGSTGAGERRQALSLSLPPPPHLLRRPGPRGLLRPRFAHGSRPNRQAADEGRASTSRESPGGGSVSPCSARARTRVCVCCSVAVAPATRKRSLLLLLMMMLGAIREGARSGSRLNKGSWPARNKCWSGWGERGERGDGRRGGRGGPLLLLPLFFPRSRCTPRPLPLFLSFSLLPPRKRTTARCDSAASSLAPERRTERARSRRLLGGRFWEGMLSRPSLALAPHPPRRRAP